MSNIVIKLPTSGKEVSEDTIVKALKEYCDFQEETDIEKYCREHIVCVYPYGNRQMKAEIKEFYGKNYVCVPLPITNNEWILNAYTWVKDFYDKFERDYYIWITYDKKLSKENPHCIWINFYKVV